MDDLFAVAHRPGQWCHLLCDDFSPAGLARLHRFALDIGLPPRAFHNPPGRSRPHYDLRPETRERALAHGAETLTRRQVVEWLERGRAAEEAASPTL